MRLFYFQHPANDDQLKQMIEHAAHHLSADNTELACAFIQKTAVEKVVPEMEKRLTDVCLLAYLCVSTCMYSLHACTVYMYMYNVHCNNIVYMYCMCTYT